MIMIKYKKSPGSFPVKIIIRELTDDFYKDLISRDEIAKFARIAPDAAQNGNRTLRDEYQRGK